MLKKAIFWLNCARIYSLPITILNCAVIFIYSLKAGGKVFYGILAVIGTALVHLATNLLDDYFDYKDENYMASSQNCKCAYLKNNQATVKDLKYAIFIFLSLAAIIGIILFFVSGVYVALLAVLALVIAMTYQKFSVNGLGEISIFIAYGPLLYEGIYYVMTGKFSLAAAILSFACAFITNTVLYVHMLMDFDGDFAANKKTLCLKLKTKDNALKLLGGFYISGFALLILLAIISKNNFYLLTFAIFPMVFDLYFNMKKFNSDKTNLPKVRFWHAPLDNWTKLAQTPDAPFYFRFFYSRNILTWFMLLICIALIIG